MPYDFPNIRDFRHRLLEVHLRLFGVQIFNRGNGLDLYDGLARNRRLPQSL